MPLDGSIADLASSGRRGSAELARDLLSASGAGKIADSEGNTFDPVGSSQGPRESFLKTVGDNVKDKVGSVIGERALDPAAAAELQAKNPQAAALLTSSTGVALELMIFLIYVGLDMGKSLYSSGVLSASSHFVATEGHQIITSALIINQGLLQLTFAFVTIAVVEGGQGFKNLANLERYRKFAIVSCLFSLAQVFATMAYTILDPGTIKILGQCRLFETAVLSRIIFNRRYSETQWMLMIIIIFGAILHIMAKQTAESAYELDEALTLSSAQRTDCHITLTSLTDAFIINRNNSHLQPMPRRCVVEPPHPHRGNAEFILGLVYVFLYMFCSDIASIVSEMFLKSEKDTPFYIQKATMESMGIPILFLMSFIAPWFSMCVGVDPSRWAPQMWWAAPGSSFMGADTGLAWCNNVTAEVHHHPRGYAIPCGLAAGGLWRDWCYLPPWGALFFNSCQSWFAGILVKLLSSVVKLLAKIVSLGGVFFLGDCWLLYTPDSGDLRPAGFAAVQVILLTFTFLNIKVPKEEVPNEPEGTKTAGVELPERPQKAEVV